MLIFFFFFKLTIVQIAMTFDIHSAQRMTFHLTPPADQITNRGVLGDPRVPHKPFE